MPKFALFDRNARLFQWMGEGATPRDVLVQFDREIGINPHNQPMDEVAEQFFALELEGSDEAALRAWDGKSNTWPLAGRRHLSA